VTAGYGDPAVRGEVRGHPGVSGVEQQPNLGRIDGDDGDSPTPADVRRAVLVDGSDDDAATSFEERDGLGCEHASCPSATLEGRIRSS